MIKHLFALSGRGGGQHGQMVTPVDIGHLSLTDLEGDYPYRGQILRPQRQLIEEVSVLGGAALSGLRPKVLAMVGIAHEHQDPAGLGHSGWPVLEVTYACAVATGEAPQRRLTAHGCDLGRGADRHDVAVVDQVDGDDQRRQGGGRAQRGRRRGEQVRNGNGGHGVLSMWVSDTT